jgi:hypothetical protein
MTWREDLFLTVLAVTGFVGAAAVVASTWALLSWALG